MRIKERFCKAVQTGVAVAAALVGVAVLLMGSIQFCLCDPDPDHCGHACHDCSAPHVTDFRGLFAESASATGEPCVCAADEGCRHVVVSAGDLFANSFVVTMPAGTCAAIPWQAVAVRPPRPLRPRPNSTAPPDSGGVYLTTAMRLYPLS